MTFLEKLRSAPDSPQAKINTFLAVFNPEGETVAAFVEGRDDPSFYRQHLEAAAKEPRKNNLINYLRGRMV
jgi:hypothetical protein